MWKRLAARAVIISLCMISSPAAFAEDRALVIGINDYPLITSRGVAGARNLRGAVSDSEYFASLLESHFGFSKSAIKHLINAQASRAAIISSFEDWLVNGTRPGDRVVFFFAGHGAQTTDEDGDEGEDKFDEAIAPADTIGELTTAPVKLENLLIDDEIGELLKKLKGREILVVIDSCNSGTATRSLLTEDNAPGFRVRTLTPYVPARTRSLLDIPDEILRQRKVGTRLIDVLPDNIAEEHKSGSLAVWTATTSSQLALDLESGGVFTQSFVEGIKNKSADITKDGKVSAKELLDYVRKVSKTVCDAKPGVCKFGLTPTLEFDDGYLSEVLSPVGAVIETVTAADTALELFKHENDFPLKIDVEPGRQLKLGDEVHFTVASARAGYLLLFDEGPDGKFRQIFPNTRSEEQHKDGEIRAGATLRIPDASYGFAFEATEKGKGTLIALVAEEAADLHKIGARSFNFERLTDVEKVLAAIAKRLHESMVTEDLGTPNGTYKWSFATLEYEVR